ncbi:MAG: bifunctional hydroxymethylpyrimidine kinase/phosphomethylpyrimidine kinase [Candidatus Caldarchaeum sp.]|nr:bifunctional hydroxymethylpyrimidine kinase/phosphomethylpyrimidine kinase [Candidatus Caldarchaeum sp.]MDW8063840.1 bifunctional hydroxymethylpyrimidine kinase/phosphomethylpyrimidine kinase [Candidatus Caldarchaeum sp.]
MVRRALTVAGSDSGGGAGIQADLKTFAAHGVHGMSAITCITAQNTFEVSAIQQIPAEIVREQIRVVVDDIGVDAVKTGMLYSEEIIEAVADELAKLKVPLVVDPVAVAKSGAQLLKPEAVDALVKKLLPLATVVTPNINEAKLLTEIDIQNFDDMVSAAEKIAAMGPQAVVVKGGHMQSAKTTDVLLYSGKIYEFVTDRIETKNTHGTGCVFASAIAANLAKNIKIPQAVEKAQKFVNEAIRRGINVGRGFGPVHPTGQIYALAEKMKALVTIKEALKMIKQTSEVHTLLPESGSNLVMACGDAVSIDDFVSVPGRIVKVGTGFTNVSEPWFGFSTHVARAVLAAMQHDPSVRSAMNIKFSEELLPVFESVGLSISSYDRSKEPEEIKQIEGRTIPWGISMAVEAAGGVTDVIYHRGDVGKEPMAIVFGTDAYDVARKIIRIAKKIGGGNG